MRNAALVLGLTTLVWAVPLHATTLEEAIAAAKEHAPEVDVAEAESDIAKARLQQAKSGGRPSAILSGTIGAGRLDPKGYFGLTADNKRGLALPRPRRAWSRRRQILSPM